MTYSGHTNAVQRVVLSPDGKRFLTAGAESSLRLWDLLASRPVAILTRHTAGVRSVAFSPDGKRAISGGTDRTVRLWDLDEKSEVQNFDGPGTGAQVVDFSSDGKHIVFANLSGLVQGWDTIAGHETWLAAGHSAPVTGLAMLPGGRFITTSEDRTVRMWRMPREDEPLPAPPPEPSVPKRSPA